MTERKVGGPVGPSLTFGKGRGYRSHRPTRWPAWMRRVMKQPRRSPGAAFGLGWGVVFCCLLLGLIAPSAADEDAADPNRPNGARGYEKTSGKGGERAALLFPRLILYPARILVTAGTYPVRTIVGITSSSGLIDRTARGLRNNRYFIPVVGLDPDPGLNAGFRASHGNPLHGGGCVTYRAAWGGTKRYIAAMTFRSRDLELSKWTYRLTGKYEIIPDHHYFGIGNVSLYANRTFYTDERYLLLGKFGYAPKPWMRWHLTAAMQRHQISRGAYVEGDEKSIEQIFHSESMAPGLYVNPQNMSGEVALTIDLRNHRGRPTSGFWGEGFFGYYKGSGPDAVNYVRYGGEAQSYISLGGSRVLVLRVAGEEARTGGALPIKITELPTLGGRSTLRGYLEDRYRDQAAVFATGEYRYAISPFAEITLFADFGKVLPRLLDVDFEDLHRSFGAGLRIATHEKFWFRLQAARSDEDLMIFGTLESAFQREDRRDRR